MNFTFRLARPIPMHLGPLAVLLALGPPFASGALAPRAGRLTWRAQRALWRGSHRPALVAGRPHGSSPRPHQARGRRVSRCIRPLGGAQHKHQGAPGGLALSPWRARGSQDSYTGSWPASCLVAGGCVSFFKPAQEGEENPLHGWVQGRDLVSLKAFLEQGGEGVNGLDRKGHTPLDYAVGDPELYTLLVTLGATHSQGGWAEVQEAWKKEGRPPMHASCAEGKVSWLHYLAVGCGQDVNACLPGHKSGSKEISFSDASAPIFYAAVSGSLPTVHLLVHLGAQVEQRDLYGSTPLMLASTYGHLDVVKFLLACGANVNARMKYSGGSPLYLAARHGHLEVVEHLLKRGANVYAKDAAWGTALHAAARWGHVSVAGLLLAYGANVHRIKEGCAGRKALHFAAEQGHLRVVLLLLAYGTDVDGVSADKRGETPLSLAVEQGHLKVVKCLLVNIKTSALSSTCLDRALRKAIVNDDVEMAKCLLEHGASLEARDSRGRSPGDLAKQLGSEAPIIALLAQVAQEPGKRA